ncbi:uncharacterized protein lrrc52 [Rhinoraja longicauda]
MFLYLRKSQGLLWEILLMGATIAADCPPKCVCDIFKVDCRNKDLNSFPKNLPLNTRYLDISKNSISEINALQINLLSDLVYLDCSHNDLSEISKLDFLSGARIAYLDISYNILKTIDQATFQTLTSLTVLKLGNNHISVVHHNALDSNIGIRELDLRNNSLTFFNVSIIKNLNGLKSISLSGNPWDCQCTVKDLSQLLRRNKVIFPDIKDIVCFSPNSMAGIPVSEALNNILHICLAPLDYFDYIFFVMVGFTIFISGIIVAAITGIIMVYVDRQRKYTETDDDIEPVLYPLERSGRFSQHMIKDPTGVSYHQDALS